MPYDVTINGDDASLQNGAELIAAIAKHKGARFLDVWAHRDNESMCMLANGDRAWLMYLKNQDEECFSSRNPEVPDDG